jgi:hypothetical protein
MVQTFPREAWSSACADADSAAARIAAVLALVGLCARMAGLV